MSVPAAITSKWQPAPERSHLSKDTEDKKPARNLTMTRWAQRDTGFSSTQLIPSGQSSITLGGAGEGDEVAQT